MPMGYVHVLQGVLVAKVWTSSHLTLYALNVQRWAHAVESGVVGWSYAKSEMALSAQLISPSRAVLARALLAPRGAKRADY